MERFTVQRCILAKLVPLLGVLCSAKLWITQSGFVRANKVKNHYRIDVTVSWWLYCQYISQMKQNWLLKTLSCAVTPVTKLDYCTITHPLHYILPLQYFVLMFLIFLQFNVNFARLFFFSISHTKRYNSCSSVTTLTSLPMVLACQLSPLLLPLGDLLTGCVYRCFCSSLK